jgi:hypothetical protein
LPVATRLLNAIHDPAAMRLSMIREASLIDFPLYHAGSGRPKDARFPQNAAHFGSPAHRFAAPAASLTRPEPA